MVTLALLVHPGMAATLLTDSAGDQVLAPLARAADIQLLTLENLDTTYDEQGYQHLWIRATLEVAQLEVGDQVDVEVGWSTWFMSGTINDVHEWGFSGSYSAGQASSSLPMDVVVGTPGKFIWTLDTMNVTGTGANWARATTTDGWAKTYLIDKDAPGPQLLDEAQGTGVFQFAGHDSIVIGDIDVPATSPTWKSTREFDGPPVADLREIWVDDVDGRLRLTMAFRSMRSGEALNCNRDVGGVTLGLFLSVYADGPEGLASVGFALRPGYSPSLTVNEGLHADATLSPGEPAYLQIVFTEAGPGTDASRLRITVVCGDSTMHYDIEDANNIRDLPFPAWVAFAPVAVLAFFRRRQIE